MIGNTKALCFWIDSNYWPYEVMRGVDVKSPKPLQCLSCLFIGFEILKMIF